MKRYKLLLSFILPFFLISCNGWLDVRPEDEIAEEDVFTSGNGFRHALNGIYYSMESENMYGLHLTWGIVDALGQVYDGESNYMSSKIISNAAEYTWDEKYLEPVLKSMWAETYTVVANCNNLIQQIKTADPDMFYSKDREKSTIWGEALALRAFLQFDMLRLYAPAPAAKPGNRKFIPYVDAYPSYVSQPKTVDECLTAIIDDLIEAKKLLWKIDSTNDFDQGVFTGASSGERTFLQRRGYRLNYWAATALLARVYLYAQKEDKALEQANEVIKFATKNEGAFAFEDYTSLGNMRFSSDIIWGLHVIEFAKLYDAKNKIEDKKNLKYFEMLEIENNYFGEDMNKKYTNGSSSQYVWQSNDKRFTYWIDDMDNMHYYYRFKKYDEAKSGSDMSISNTMLPMIRMSEVYYIAAEVLAKQEGEGFAKAQSYLRTVKSGRGLKSTDKSMLAVDNATPINFMDVLIKDMRRDWIGEGQTFYIYKRLNMNIPGSRYADAIVADEKIFVVPIPDGETNLN